MYVYVCVCVCVSVCEVYNMLTALPAEGSDSPLPQKGCTGYDTKLNTTVKALVHCKGCSQSILIPIDIILKGEYELNIFKSVQYQY